MQLKSISSNRSRGFTLIELMVVVGIIGIFAAIILVYLGSAKDKSRNTRVVSELKAMTNQAPLFVGTSSAVGATQSALSGTSGGNLFTDTNNTNSLYRLAVALPSGTFIYYASEALSPLVGGKWAFAASTSNGSYCVDYTGVGKSQTSTIMTSSNGPAIYPSLSSTYSCN